MRSGVYLTTYCNRPHRRSDGKPVEHECYVLPPEAIQAELQDDYREAVRLIEAARPMRLHRGVKA